RCGVIERRDHGAEQRRHRSPFINRGATAPDRFLPHGRPRPRAGAPRRPVPLVPTRHLDRRLPGPRRDLVVAPVIGAPTVAGSMAAHASATLRVVGLTACETTREHAKMLVMPGCRTLSSNTCTTTWQRSRRVWPHWWAGSILRCCTV